MVIPLIFNKNFDTRGLEFSKNKKNSLVAVAHLNKSFIDKNQNGTYEIENITLDDFHSMGTLCRILRVAEAPTGDLQVLVTVKRRLQFNKIISKRPYLVGEVTYPHDVLKNQDSIDDYTSALISKIRELIKANSLFSEEMKLFISRYGSTNQGQLADMVAGMLTSPGYEELLAVLDNLDIEERIIQVLQLVHKEIEISKVKEKINKSIEEKISKQQRTYFLQEQLKEIKAELGLEKDEKQADIEKLKERIEKLRLSEEATKVVDSEMSKLSLYDVRSSEYGVSRNYLDWILSLPWGQSSEERLDIQKVQTQLNKDHFGMEDIKDRILEFVAVQILKKTTTGSILCFVGPPGVGKTSLGKSIAKSLNRQFYNFSLGGMRDEAEIKGHRRTYIGAMPGKIIQALKAVKTDNPVIMLDEIDKLSSSYQGDPASSLLEVLDPEQNNAFLDHYLDLRFDLSKVLFVATANQLDTIPPALLDRMEVIRLSGYILEEKREIAKRFVIPKQLKLHGIEKRQIKFPAKTLDTLIRSYAREAGVRSLEQQIKKILRKVARNLVKEKDFSLNLNPEKIEDYLGKEIFKSETPYEKIVPGIVTGLAWTSMGGAPLYIESIATSTDNKGFKLTGQLGKVMKESAEIAYSYSQSILPQFSKNQFFEKNTIHLHVPAGATPKDGPSAGITMALSLISLALNKKIPEKIAMTGELTTSGYVLPIGGVKEKLIAAKQFNKKIIIFPYDNRRDFEELDTKLKKGISAHFVKRFEDVLHITLKL